MAPWSAARNWTSLERSSSGGARRWRISRRWKETFLVGLLIFPALWPVWRYEIDSLVELTAPSLVPDSPALTLWNSSIAGHSSSRTELPLIVHIERLRSQGEARDWIQGEPDWPLDASFSPPPVFPYSEYAFRRYNLIITVKPRLEFQDEFPEEGFPEIIELAHQIDHNIVALHGTSIRRDVLGSRIFEEHLKPRLKTFRRRLDSRIDALFP